jgi:hypothetical protein
MKILSDWEDYLEFANSMLDKGPKFLCISSFGFYANITSEDKDTSEWGEKYTNTVRKIVDRAIEMKIPTSILVGVSFNECKPGCTDCRRTNIKKHNYLAHHKKRFKEKGVKIKMVTKHHMKMFLTDTQAIIGGMNFTESNWFDMSVGMDYIDNPALIEDFQWRFKEAWSLCTYNPNFK